MINKPQVQRRWAQGGCKRRSETTNELTWSCKEGSYKVIRDGVTRETSSALSPRLIPAVFIVLAPAEI